MKRFLIACGMLTGLAAVSHAQAQAINVHEVAFSSATSTQIAVSSTTATAMTALDGRFSIEIQNQDGTASLWCGFAAVELTTSKGRKIAPGASWTVALGSRKIAPGSAVAALDIYCLSDSASATTNAQVVQIR